MYPFERFTDSAKNVLVLAQGEAERAKHSYIGTEHVLLALLASGSDATRILQQLGADEPAVRAQFEKVIGRNERIEIVQIIPTSRVKKVIELAVTAAEREGSQVVTPEHMLVGLLEEGQGIAANVLADLGVTLEAVARAREA